MLHLRGFGMTAGNCTQVSRLADENYARAISASLCPSFNNRFYSIYTLRNCTSHCFIILLVIQPYHINYIFVMSIICILLLVTYKFLWCTFTLLPFLKDVSKLFTNCELLHCYKRFGIFHDVCDAAYTFICFILTFLVAVYAFSNSTY